MIAALIAAASLFALFPLFVSYCGTVLVAAKSVDFPIARPALAETEGRGVSANDFDRILQLVRLCPEYAADRSSVRAITVYYRLHPCPQPRFRRVQSETGRVGRRRARALLAFRRCGA